MGKRDITTKFSSAKRKAAYQVDPKDLLVVGIDTPKDSTDELYDESVHLPIKDETIQNIMEFGVIHPIVVTNRDGKYVVVAGRKRTLCLRKVNEILLSEGKDPMKIDVVLRDSKICDLEGLAISENEHRSIVGPLDRMQRAKRYLDNGHQISEAAIVFGVTDKTIRNWISILSMDCRVIDKVICGEMTTTAALKLAGLPREDQVKAADELTEQVEPDLHGKPPKSPTTKEAQAKAQKSSGKKDNATPAPGKKLIRKVVKDLDSAGKLYPASWLKWALGDIPPDKVPGLREILTNIAKRPRKKR